MRSNLKIFSLIVIAMLMITTIVVPSMAQNVNWSANAVSITEYAEATGLSSQCNAKRFGRPIGGWTSTAGVLPQVVAGPGMTYEFSLKTTGVLKIEEAVLTPDSGNTLWYADMTSMKGFMLKLPIGIGTVKSLCKVPLPKRRESDKTRYEDRVIDVPTTGLPVGEMSGVEWRVKSRDKHNKLIILIIPISWDSIRTTCAGSAIMVQFAPDGFEDLTNISVFSLLRGFVPAWAAADPAVIAQQQMIAQQQPQPQVQVQEQPQVQIQEQIQNNDYSQNSEEIQVDGVVGEPVSSTITEPSRVTKVTITVIKDAKYLIWRDQKLDMANFESAKFVEFQRDGRYICMATFSYDQRTRNFELKIIRGDFPKAGDQLIPIDAREVR